MKKIALLSALFCCCLQLCYSQAGKLDPSFGNNGIVIADLGVSYNYPIYAIKILMQPDGSIYLVLSGNETIIVKQHPDGSTDLSYGHNGTSATGPIAPNSAVLQSDGKIIVVGSSGGNFG